MNSNELANMVIGLMSLVVGLSAIFVIFYTNTRYRYKKDKKSNHLLFYSLQLRREKSWRSQTD
jgi:hypothetical protein